MRIAQRNHKADYATLDPQQETQLVSTILQMLRPKHTSVVAAPNLHVPEHFLLKTILPTGLQQTTGYVSPVLDVQPDIHFIRTQRRFNKRRYARVRVSSRPSF
jgi:hypothetical protein